MMALACAYYLDTVNPETLTLGKPEHHADGTVFSMDDYHMVEKWSRTKATFSTEKPSAE